MLNSDYTQGVGPIPVSPPTSIQFLQKKVFLAFPFYKSVHPLTFYCIAQLMDRRRTVSALNFGDAFIAHSRNNLVDAFLKSECEWVLFMDDDTLFPFGNAAWYNAHTGFNLPEKFAGFNTIDRLLSHGKTLVGGLYFGRWPSAYAMYGEAANQSEGDYARKAPYDLIKPTRWCGTGCLLAHRKVFEDIEKRFPRLARGADGKGGNYFSSSEHTAMDWIDRTREMLSKGPMDGDKALRAYEMLERAAAEARQNSTLGMGEDVQMCVRAKEAGHQCYVDMGLLCGHVGNCVYGPHNTGIKRSK